MRIFNEIRSNRAVQDKEVSKADKVWMNSIVRRQYMVLDDLIKFNQCYPDKIDKEIVGSLFSIYEMLRDTSTSIIYSHNPDTDPQYR